MKKIILIGLILTVIFVAGCVEDQTTPVLKEENVQLIYLKTNFTDYFNNFKDIYNGTTYQENLEILCDFCERSGCAMPFTAKIQLTLPENVPKTTGFHCKFYIDGKEMNPSPYLFEASNDLIFMSSGTSGVPNTNVQINLCCSLDISMRNQICKSAILPKKC